MSSKKNIYTRTNDNKIYDFVPYRYGCFSFEANKDIVSLSKEGYILIPLNMQNVSMS